MVKLAAYSVKYGLVKKTFTTITYFVKSNKRVNSDNYNEVGYVNKI